MCLQSFCIFSATTAAKIFFYNLFDSVPLVNRIKEGCENLSMLLILLISYLKYSQKSNLSLENKNLKWGGNMIMK